MHILLREGRNLEHDLNRFWEVETMMQPITTKEQAREEHFLAQPNNQMEDLLFDFQSRCNPINF